MINATLERVRAFARIAGWSRNRLALEAGIRESTLRRMHCQQWNPTAETLQRLEAAIERHQEAELRRVAEDVLLLRATG